VTPGPSSADVNNRWHNRSTSTPAIRLQELVLV